jgi:Mg-chelatase subunit ChlD
MSVTFCITPSKPLLRNSPGTELCHELSTQLEFPMSNDFPTDPREALEASLTALVLGELPADQAAFLRDAISRDPELARRYERLKQTVELVRVTAKTPVTEMPAPAPALKLSGNRRDALLQHFKTVTPKEFGERSRNKILWLIPASIAAVLISLCGMLWMPQLSKTKSLHLLSTQVAPDMPQRLDRSWQLETLRREPSREGRVHSVQQPDGAAPPARITPGESQIFLPLGAGIEGQDNSTSAIGDLRRSQQSSGAVFFSDSNPLMLRSSGNPGAQPLEPSRYYLSLNSASAGGGLGGAGPGLSRAFPTQEIDPGQSAAFRLRYGGEPVTTSTEGASLAKNETPVAVDPVTGLPVQLVNPPEVASTTAASSPTEEQLLTSKSAAMDNLAGYGIDANAGGRAKEHNLTPQQGEAGSKVAERSLNGVAPAENKRDIPSAPSGPSFHYYTHRGYGGEPAKPSDQNKLPEQVPQLATSSSTAIPISGIGARPRRLSTNTFDHLAQLGDETRLELGRTEAHLDHKLTQTAPGQSNAIDVGLQVRVYSLESGLVKLDKEPKDVEKKQNDDKDAPLPKPPAAPPVPQPEILTGENAFSTFSLNVSDVSFKLAAASLEKGAMPDPASIRVEEFINAFDYRDPEPAAGVPIAFMSERAQYPFAQNRDLLRFSLKTAAQGRQAGRPLNLVLLLDNSGSMERADRVRIIQEALRVLAAQLQAQDTFSVVTFARTARLWVDGIPGNQAGKVAEEISGLTPQGGTNLEEAINLGYQAALRHYLPNGVNRVVLLTDGAANLGNVDPETLKQKVETNRKQGIALDCFGIGWEGFNDDLLEVLTRNGDGRYGFINTPEEAAGSFANQLAGALHVAAADVKVQVEFNPSRVTTYRQIGYARHQLTKEQFRDNTVDAAEIGAAESGNALYVVETNPNGEGPIATVRVRYKVPGTAEFHEHEWPVPYTGKADSLPQASPALRLAATASSFGEWLSTSPYAAEVTPDGLLGYLNGVPEMYGADTRPKTLEWMIRQAKAIAGK